MPEVGVRELKARASEIIRDVREHGGRYVITYRGRPVGMLVPVQAGQSEPDDAHASSHDAWKELWALGEKIGREWKSPLSAVELLSQMRR